MVQAALARLWACPRKRLAPTSGSALTGPTSLVISAVDGGAFASATLPGMTWFWPLWSMATPTSRPLPRP